VCDGRKLAKEEDKQKKWKQTDKQTKLGEGRGQK